MRRIPALALIVLSLSAAGDPWSSGEVLQPAEVAALKNAPLLIHVGFPVLYRSAHASGSVYAGPGSKPEGIEALKQAVADEPRSRAIVLYCGCCPWEKC